MRPAHWTSLIRLCALVALAASAALFVDYTSASPAFCSLNSGCATVRASGYGYLLLPASQGRVLPVPVPLIGLLGIGLLFTITLFRAGKWRNRLLVGLSLLGGAVSAFLLALQAAVIHRFCVYCVTVDSAMLIIAGLSIAYVRARRAQESTSDQPEPLKLWAWTGLAILGVAGVLAWPLFKPEPPVPAGVRALYVPGKINVVEFADFECPFCRMLYPRLNAVIKDYPGRVHFVRLNLPLSIHPHARVAARAGLCAEAQGKGAPMAHALFTLDPLSLSAIRRAAVGLDLDMDRFDHCMSDPATDRRIDQQSQILRKAGFEGLPTTFVENKEIIGAQPEDVFRDAFDRAARGESERGVPAPLYASGVGLLALALAFAGRRRRYAT